MTMTPVMVTTARKRRTRRQPRLPLPRLHQPVLMLLQQRVAVPALVLTPAPVPALHHPQQAMTPARVVLTLETRLATPLRLYTSLPCPPQPD